MPKIQCPWCGRSGERFDEMEKFVDVPPQPHEDGSKCVCRHVTAGSRERALEVQGRYWDAETRTWVCTVCD